MGTREVLDSILRGEHDDNLDAISTAVRERRGATSKTNFLLAKPGGTGRINQTCKPAYLRGAPVSIVSKNTKRLVVKLDPSWLAANPQASRWSANFTVPPELIELD